MYLIIDLTVGPLAIFCVQSHKKNQKPKDWQTRGSARAPLFIRWQIFKVGTFYEIVYLQLGLERWLIEEGVLDVFGNSMRQRFSISGKSLARKKQAF